MTLHVERGRYRPPVEILLQAAAVEDTELVEDMGEVQSLGGQRHERLDHRAVAVARQLHQNRVAGRVILGVERAQIAARGRHRAVELSGLLHPRAAAWLRLVVW